MQEDWKAGTRYRVIRDGARLSGMKSVAPYVQQSWALKLACGDIIVCDGVKWTAGDGVPVVKWRGGNGEWLAQDCTFEPQIGGMWAGEPAPGFLERVET